MTDATISEWVGVDPAARVVLVGAGGLGVMTADALMALGHHAAQLGYLDDGHDAGSERGGVHVLGGVELAASIAESHPAVSFVVAIADNRTRRDIVQRFPYLNFRSVVHPRATVSPLAQVGVGSIIMPGVVIDPESRIGAHCVLNKLASIGHNCTMDDFVQLAPNVGSGGHHGEGSFVGMGASVLPGVTLGAWSTVGAGAVAHRDVPVGATVVGVPARER